MARTFQIKRGSKATMPTLAQGEFGFVTDSGAEELHIGTGSQNIQIARRDYVDTAVANLVNSAPETLNTLDELATALGDDPNFATTVATQIGNKADTSALTSHTGNTSNPHGVTAAQVGAVPTDRTVNGKALSANITLTAADVGAPTVAEMNAAIEAAIAAAIANAIGGNY